MACNMATHQVDRAVDLTKNALPIRLTSKPEFLNSTRPVDIPRIDELFVSDSGYMSYLDTHFPAKIQTTPETSATDISQRDGAQSSTSGSPFINDMKKFQAAAKNVTRTENGDPALASSDDPRVDLFQELEKTVQGDRLLALLQSSWNIDPISTLKIIINDRSIHLGKSSRPEFYRCMGWLAEHHPRTLLLNLIWLVRPVVPKKPSKKDPTGQADVEDAEDMVLVDNESTANDATRYDVKDGLSHGYWNDLCNILILSATDRLSAEDDPYDTLNVHISPRKRIWDETAAKAKKLQRRHDRFNSVKLRLGSDTDHPFHRALHVTVARLFVDQLKKDLAIEASGDKKAFRRISLCAKWAPTPQGQCDKYTFLPSSLAEMLHPPSEFDDIDITDRPTYLLHAINKYRQDLARLRRALDIVERHITSGKLDQIKYDRVPSFAMQRYTPLFINKDQERFQRYIDEVALGNKRISGATLLPSQMISLTRRRETLPKPVSKMTAREMIRQTEAQIASKALDGQWNSLVQRVKASGTLDNCIAVCDVSGSMTNPGFTDGTCPLDTALGLSLVIADTTKAPFGGHFISFSAKPELVSCGDSTQSLSQRVEDMVRSNWMMNTDFRAVFMDLILPTAIEHEISQEDMIKRIFVFSDMHFDQAQTSYYEPREHGQPMTSSFEDIKKAYAKAGYDMPEIVFWNLAGAKGAAPAPKQAAADEEGIAIVSGYSQALLKMFLEGSPSEQENDEDEAMIEIGEDGEERRVIVERKRMTPLDHVKKAIGHPSYRMFEVVD